MIIRRTISYGRWGTNRGLSLRYRGSGVEHPEFKPSYTAVLKRTGSFMARVKSVVQRVFRRKV